MSDRAWQLLIAFVVIVGIIIIVIKLGDAGAFNMIVVTSG
jgi:hypothetical protein